ncbi:MAG: DsbA family protein [Terriglobales bacterium]
MKPALLSILGVALVVLVAFTSAPKPSAGPDPILGNVQSKIRVIIYQDLECPDCAQWHQIFKNQIIPRFGKEVGFEFRDYPLPQHQWSFNASVLARYFDTRNPKTGMAWRNYCFTHQTQISAANLMDTATRWARPYGITRMQLENAFANPDLFARVQADQQRGNRDHVQHTPTVLFNGTEAKTPQQLEIWLAQAIAAAH